MAANRKEPDGLSDSQDSGTSLVNVPVNISDIYGIGKAAQTPAAKSILDSFARLVTSVSNPLRIYLSGHAEISVEKRRIVALAEANARAALISGASDSELYERTSQRVIAEETRKQVFLEKATIEAARIASKSAVERPNEVPDDWMEKWAEGAQTASSEQVRGLYSRILEHCPVSMNRM
jgi:hypothetical protein